MTTVVDRDQKPGFLPTTLESELKKPKAAAGPMGTPKRKMGKKPAAKKTAKRAAPRKPAKKTTKKK